MLKKIASQLSYANVVSSVCLFIVLGGTSYALSTGAIDSREIKNNTVRGKDIRNGTVRSRDVGNGSLLARDFAGGELPAGPAGPAGPRGLTGSRGPAGEDGFGLLTYPFETGVLENGQSTEIQVPCPSGTFPTGGDAGARDATTLDDVGNQVIVNQGIDFPPFGSNPVGYFAVFDNQLASGNDADIIVDAVCANASSVIASNVKRAKRWR